jgi:hypothetical protein
VEELTGRSDDPSPTAASCGKIVGSERDAWNTSCNLTAEGRWVCMLLEWRWVESEIKAET